MVKRLFKLFLLAIINRWISDIASLALMLSINSICNLSFLLASKKKNLPLLMNEEKFAWENFSKIEINEGILKDIFMLIFIKFFSPILSPIYILIYNDKFYKSTCHELTRFFSIIFFFTHNFIINSHMMNIHRVFSNQLYKPTTISHMKFFLGY